MPGGGAGLAGRRGWSAGGRGTGDNDCDGYVDVEKSNFPVELTNGERALP